MAGSVLVLVSAPVEVRQVVAWRVGRVEEEVIFDRCNFIKFDDISPVKTFMFYFYHLNLSPTFHITKEYLSP